MVAQRKKGKTWRMKFRLANLKNHNAARQKAFLKEWAPHSLDILRRYNFEKQSISEIAAHYKVSPACMWRVCRMIPVRMRDASESMFSVWERKKNAEGDAA
jgi:hypothetical protein